MTGFVGPMTRELMALQRDRHMDCELRIVDRFIMYSHVCGLRTETVQVVFDDE